MLIAVKQKLRPPANGRQDTRHKVILRATLICAGTAVVVHLLDLSKKGALVHADLPHETNEMVWLSSNGIEIPARIAWTRGSRFGLSFGIALSDTQLNAMIRAH